MKHVVRIREHSRRATEIQNRNEGAQNSITQPWKHTVTHIAMNVGVVWRGLRMAVGLQSLEGSGQF